MKLFFTAIALFAWMASPTITKADAVKFFGTPETYSPGQTFSFGVSLPDTTDLASYQVDVLLSSATGIAGTDYVFGIAVPNAPSERYVFASNQFFDSGTNLESMSLQRISLTDFDLVGVNTTVGINDRIATIDIQTAIGFKGELRLSIDASRLILDGPELTPTPIDEFAAIHFATLNQPVTVITAIPEPGSITLFFAVTCVWGMRRRRQTKCGKPI